MSMLRLLAGITLVTIILVYIIWMNVKYQRWRRSMTKEELAKADEENEREMQIW